ncbi:esterase family protein [Candidatus Sumerlaeota bacterium]|nr:esterase family protein [Candidatus Sumerlaeota bacterium]
MRRISPFLLISLLCGAAPAGELLNVHHTSEALSCEMVFDVYVPDGDVPPGGWPVLYLLHGAWGNHTDWWRVTDVESVAEECGVMLVFPDGGQFGWYLDSPVDPSSQRESYLIGEVLPLVDRTFRTRTDREGRGICGLSMGGHGAISLAAKHPDLFGSASSLSGILDITRHGDRWELPLRLGPLEEGTESWRAHSCVYLADRFVDADVRIFFDCGIDDTVADAITDGRLLRDRLLELGVPYIWAEHVGAHTWDHWSEHIGEHVRWHAEGF